MTGDASDASTPAPNPALRASDAERERTATQLRDHFAAGRITSDELNERLDAAYRARTVGELDALQGDLPPLAAPHASDPARERARRRVLHAVGLTVLANLAFVALWLATGADGNFWPRWIIVLSAIRLAFYTWGELGPSGGDESSHGRGGARRIEGAPQRHRRR